MSEYYSYKEYNYEKILSTLKFNFGKNKKWKKVFCITKVFFTSMITRYKSDVLGDENYDFLFIKTQDREDYNLLYKQIYSQCKYTKLDLVLKRSIRMNTLFIFEIISIRKKLSDFIKKHGVLDGVFLYIMFLRYKQYLNIIKNIKFENLIVFSEVQPVENLFVQYSKLNNKKTVTLQHGLYIDYTNYPNVNMFNYLDVQSEYLLAWGINTKELFEKYNPKLKIFVCGKPVEIKPILCEIDNNLFGILLDQPLFRQYNKELLDIAFEFARNNNMKVVIKEHPADNLNNYIIDFSLLNESDIEKTSFIVAHTTSLIQEFILQGKKVLKYKSDIPSHEYSEIMVFSNIAELEEKYKYDYDVTQEAIQYIAFSGNKSKNRYACFFDCLFNGKPLGELKE